MDAGDTIENPITGERITFRRTSLDTNGDAVVIESLLRPGGHVVAAHVHPRQEERAQVLRGTIGFRVGRNRFVAVPGDRVTIRAGTPHAFWNTGDADAHLVYELRPALQLEQLFASLFALAAEGKTDARGMPNLLRLAVIGSACFDTARLAFPPSAVQKAAITIAAPVARLLGYGSAYRGVTAIDPVAAA